MLSIQVVGLLMIATAMAADPAAPPADKGLSGTPAPKADTKSDTTASGADPTKAGDPTKGVDSKGAACTCPAPPTDSVKSPAEDPAKPADEPPKEPAKPEGETPSGSTSTFSLLSQKTQLGYVGTSLLAALVAISA